jgi:glycosyltransferase involved in cell wall biosynthesis
MPYVNLSAVWAAKLAGSRARVVVNERIEISHYVEERRGWRHAYLLPLMARTYARADAIVGVSDGVGDDLARATGIDRNRITTVYNPIVTRELLRQASESVDHHWFQPGTPPVVISVGRLADQKDHPTLLHAFAQARSQREMRLVILGGAGNTEKTAERQAQLMGMARDLGVADDVQLLGYQANPYRYLARAGVFALSSRYEGLPTVLVEAMACGCPVVSTACPGSVEILEGGRYGQIVPIGDAEALGRAITATLASPPDQDTLKRRSLDFSAERSVEHFERLLTGSEGRG